MIESNKLMAKFLGWEYHNSQDISKLPKWVNNGKKVCTNHEQLKFHTDWNDLMQVVEKIENYSDDPCHYYYVIIEMNECTILYNDEIFIEVVAETKTQAVYSACLQFIQNVTTNT